MAGAATKREVVQISSYSRRLKENVKSILDNYGEILKAAKVSESGGSTSGDYDAMIYQTNTEIQVRATNMVRAAESLSQLVAELKEYLILNDFSTINDTTSARANELREAQKQIQDDTNKLFDSNKQNQKQSLGLMDNV